MALGEELLKKLNLKELHIELTNKCNLNCEHCFQYKKDENGNMFNGFITSNEIDAFFANKKIGIIAAIKITGGEPLLNIEAIEYLIAKIIKENILVYSMAVYTNGTILSEKFADCLNKFSVYLQKLYKITPGFEKHQSDFFINNGNQPISLRISKDFHDNSTEDAYIYYKSKLKNVYVDIQNDTFKELAYSGRAKSLSLDKINGFYVDTPHHKICFVNKYMVMCPLLLSYNGDLSISALCEKGVTNKNVLGNVFDNISLLELIEEWNYKTPLTCQEACDKEKYFMWKEINKIEDKKVNEFVCDTFIKKYELIEKWCKEIHNKYLYLLPDKIEEFSNKIYNIVSCNKSEYIKQKEIEKIEQLMKIMNDGLRRN